MKLSKVKISIDISPLANPHSGIGRSVSGLLSELLPLSASAGVSFQPYFRKMLGTAASHDIAEYNATRLRLPRSAEGLIRSLGLVEATTKARLYHATDFYLPLKASTPAISTIYDVIYATNPEGSGDQARIATAMKRFVSQCVRVISCSEYSAREFCTLYGYPENQVTVINLGVDTKLFAPAPQVAVPGNAGVPYFFAVSCNETRKNTPRLIRAFIRYALAGGSYNLKLAWHLPEHLTEEVRQAGLTDRIIALGKVSQDTLVALYQQAACVVFPSLYEGFGFPVIEALACGVPVMTTRRSSLPEVGGEVALYVDGEDTDEMAQWMAAFERNELGPVAQRSAIEGPDWAARFTWRNCAEKTLETYLSALSEIDARPWKPLVLRPST